MSSELSDNGKKTSKQQTICIISDEVIDCNLENRSDVAEIPQKSNMQKTNALPENSGNVFPVQQTVTYVPLNKLSSSNHIRQLRTYWIEPLVIIDIINKLNEKYSKHGVRLFDFLREHIDNEITMRFDDCRFAKPDNQPVLNSKQILDELNRIHGKQIYNLDECVLYDGGEFEIMSNLKTPEKQLNCIKCKSRNGCDCSPDGELASIKYIPTRCSSTSNDSNNEKNIPNRAKTPYHPVTKKSVLSPSENKIVKKSESPHKSSLKRKGKRKSSRRRSRFTSSSSDITTSSSSSRSSSSSPHRSRRSRHRSRKRSRYSRGRHESKRRRSESHRSRTSTRHRSRSTDNKSKKDDLMPKTNTDFFYRLSDKSFKYAADSENFLQNSFLTTTNKYLDKNESKEQTPQPSTSVNIKPQMPYYGGPSYEQPMFYADPQMYQMYVPGPYPGPYPGPHFPYGFNPMGVPLRLRRPYLHSRFSTKKKPVSNVEGKNDLEKGTDDKVGT